MNTPNTTSLPPQTSIDPKGATPPKNSLAENLAWRAFANWSSQLISWAVFLIVIRLLSPADFGLVGMSMTLYWYLKFLGGFGITASVVRHRDLTDETLAQLNTMGVVFGVASFLLACAFVWPVSLFFRTPRMVPVAVVTSTALLSLGFRSVPEGLMNQRMRLKSLSFLDAFRDILSAAVTFVLAWMGFHFWALVLGNLVSDIVRTAIVLSVQRHRFAWPHWPVVRVPLMFGGRVLISSFAWSTYNTLDNVTAGRVLGQSALGIYGMAWNLANTPLEKIVSLVTTLIPAYLSRVQTDMAALRHYVRSLSEVIALATFPATIGIALVAHQAVPLIMGQKWSSMVAPLQVLSIYAAFRSLVALLPKVLTAVGNARFVMRVEVTGLIVMPVAFWIGSHWGITGIAYGWVFAYPLVAFPHYWKTLKTISMPLSDYIRALRPAIDSSGAMIVSVLIFQRLVHSIHSRWLYLIVEIAIGGIAYLGILATFHRSRMVYFLSFVKKAGGAGKNDSKKPSSTPSPLEPFARA
ncbi:MAG TPA: lipopolysaccharide biosynthesis protein [Candidatus Sulfotelmatobacter sp.]|nr:lipopolysaccharide biosynthesis protein [Candidatus Sulfotelmatobacter sp.]